MLTKIATLLTIQLQKNGVVSEESEDVYIYGFELLISFIFSTTIIITLGLIFDVFLETLCFLVVFILLRSFTGGYHAKKYWQCTIVTLAVYAFTMVLSKTILPNIAVYTALVVVGVTVIFIMAPVENCNKPLSAAEKKRHKLVSIVLFVAFFLLSLLCYNSHPSLSASVLLVDLFMILISVTIQPLILKLLHGKK